MSVQFGICNFDGKPVDAEDLDRVRPLLAPYGPDGDGSICKDNFGILFRAFHTTRESRKEVQPQANRSGSVLAWDGRLDNRADLIRELQTGLSNISTDLSIVRSAYERWGIGSFARLLGDWALSIWDPRSQTLILAKDFVGTRHLYYSVEKHSVAWCTILDPLVLFADHSLKLEEEYIAGWLSFFPAVHLTPYAGIHAVPPASFLRLTKSTRIVTKYWECDPARQIRFRSDREYEEGYRAVFAEAVKRRLRSDAPILAELSGGMDSSAIVCMADDIISSGSTESPKLSTLSYYDDSEPNWNERPYFTKVEEKRCQSGYHIDVSGAQSLKVAFGTDSFVATPSFLSRSAAKQATECMVSEGIRAILSGIGGDEITGGVPAPLPELADLLATGHFRKLAHGLRMWALSARKPWFHLFLETLRAFCPNILVGAPEQMRPAEWLDSTFVARHRGAFSGYQTRLKLLGPRPSFQEDVSTLENLRRQLGCFPLACDPPREVRYPYLDRDFVEFIYAVPREQLLRPGQRRSLMRRALGGIVPDAILNRRRKAFASRGGVLDVKACWSDFGQLNSDPLISRIGIVDSASFSNAIDKACKGQETHVITILRGFALECWLRSIANRRDPRTLEFSPHRTSLRSADSQAPITFTKVSAS
ncbi:MAG TPA: asparagine synthase-related protein [Candidatus Sulfotelmatobacter sp.]|nr:asparagine synthase-related protein [Candidatus Sulfotelmatobacter sp.]